MTFSNGATKQTRLDGTTLIRFANGDVEILCSATGRNLAYYHSQSEVVEISAQDGSKIYEFPNRQVERHYMDGRKLIRFPDGSKKRVFADGAFELFPANGGQVVQHHAIADNKAM